MKIYKIRKLHEEQGIHIQDMTWTQVVSNPTAIASILINIDNMNQGDMLEITVEKE